MKQSNFTLNTPRLLLRPFEKTDIKDLIEWTNDKAVMRYHDGPFDEERSINYLEVIINDFQKISPLGAMAVVLKSDGKVIGLNSVGPIRILNDSPIEISYDISRSYWNKGYATEAARERIRHIFRETAISEVIAIINPQNAQSAKVAQKLCMTYAHKIDWPTQGLVDVFKIKREDYWHIFKISCQLALPYGKRGL
jgi:ribosomal-protein-alanine N-acetyltransferase